MSLESALSEFGVFPLKDNLLVDIVDRGERTTTGGIILPDDDFKETGIRPRWARVRAVGSGAVRYGVGVGDYVLLEHGDWSRALPDGEGGKVWMTTIHKCTAKSAEAVHA